MADTSAVRLPDLALRSSTPPRRRLRDRRSPSSAISASRNRAASMRCPRRTLRGLSRRDKPCNPHLRRQCRPRSRSPSFLPPGTPSGSTMPRPTSPSSATTVVLVGICRHGRRRQAGADRLGQLYPLVERGGRRRGPRLPLGVAPRDPALVARSRASESTPIAVGPRPTRSATRPWPCGCSPNGSVPLRGARTTRWRGLRAIARPGWRRRSTARPTCPCPPSGRATTSTATRPTSIGVRVATGVARWFVRLGVTRGNGETSPYVGVVYNGF